MSHSSNNHILHYPTLFLFLRNKQVRYFSNKSANETAQKHALLQIHFSNFKH